MNTTCDVCKVSAAEQTEVGRSGTVGQCLRLTTTYFPANNCLVCQNILYVEPPHRPVHQGWPHQEHNIPGNTRCIALTLIRMPLSTTTKCQQPTESTHIFHKWLHSWFAIGGKWSQLSWHLFCLLLSVTSANNSAIEHWPRSPVVIGSICTRVDI